jgi:hypothetical protein
MPYNVIIIIENILFRSINLCNRAVILHSFLYIMSITASIPIPPYEFRSKIVSLFIKISSFDAISGPHIIHFALESSPLTYFTHSCLAHLGGRNLEFQNINVYNLNFPTCLITVLSLKLRLMSLIRYFLIPIVYSCKKCGKIDSFHSRFEFFLFQKPDVICLVARNTL